MLAKDQSSEIRRFSLPRYPNGSTKTTYSAANHRNAAEQPFYFQSLPALLPKKDHSVLTAIWTG
ncbi:MAG: hypothetical protein ACREDR_35305, partial [Blastocatellia bacterium]